MQVSTSLCLKAQTKDFVKREKLERKPSNKIDKSILYEQDKAVSMFEIFIYVVCSLQTPLNTISCLLSPKA